ncbi:MAG: DUF4492 domain-containing protein [Marinifilaceae bacterium]|jgi:beta-lactamase regulating signal transducer with metallopeptidase domain|nr:DUF4492 domain-containing protein [Marinifilaceae bacterium]
MSKILSLPSRIYRFYYEGFKNQGKWSKRLWLIIFIKLIIMFAVLKIFFFPNYLNTNFESDSEKSEHVINELTNSKRTK